MLPSASVILCKRSLRTRRRKHGHYIIGHVRSGPPMVIWRRTQAEVPFDHNLGGVLQ